MRPRSSGKATIIATFACLTAAAVAPAGLSAQVGTVDEGTFRITVEGRSVGTEDFSIRRTGTGTHMETVATGRVQVNLPGGPLELTPRLRGSGLQADPVAYELVVGGDAPRRIVGTLAPGRFSARIASPTGEQMREYVVSSGAVILDEGVAHHHYFLAQRLRSGRVPVIIPRENRQVMATVTDRGETTVNIAGTPVRAYHLVLRPEGLPERQIWVDSLNRVLRVDIPERNYQAVRTAAPR